PTLSLVGAGITHGPTKVGPIRRDRIRECRNESHGSSGSPQRAPSQCSFRSQPPRSFWAWRVSHGSFYGRGGWYGRVTSFPCVSSWPLLFCLSRCRLSLQSAWALFASSSCLPWDSSPPISLSTTNARVCVTQRCWEWRRLPLWLLSVSSRCTT